MKSLNESWLKENKGEYKVEELKRIKSEIVKCSEAYKDVFNGELFYESWDLDSALQEITSYIDEDALILVPKCNEKTIGFLVSIDEVPENQRQYVQYLENIKFVEEIGVLSSFRKNGIASEMVRTLLLNYLNPSDKYLGYRTNAMRYFDKKDSESFESATMRIQKEDKIKRIKYFCEP